MAKIIPISNSRYNPISFDEMLKPVMMQEQAHQQIEEDYMNTSNQLAQMSNYINPELDNELYNMYQEFNTNLDAQASDLSANGLNSTTRNKLLAMKRAYNQNIVPIEQAIQSRNQDAALANELYMKDNSILSNYNPNTTSLQEYINNPNRRVQSISGKEITGRVASALQNYKNTLSSQSNWKSTAGGQLIERIENYGLTPQIVQEIKENPDKYPDITGIINDITSSYNTEGWSDEDNIRGEIMNRAYEGLVYGIGQTKTDVRNNANFIPEHLRPPKEKEVTNVGLNADSDILGRTNNTKKIVEGLYNTYEGTSNKDIRDIVYKDGKLISPEEYKEIAEKKKEDILNRYSMVDTNSMGSLLSKEMDTVEFAYRDYLNRLKSLGINNPESMSKSEVEKAVKSLESYGEYDASFRHRGRLYMDDSASDSLTTKLVSLIGDGKLESITGYGDDGKYSWEYDEDSKDIAKLMDKKQFKVLQTNIDYSTGEPSFRALVDGKVKEYKLPISVFSVPQQQALMNITKELNNAMASKSEYIQLGSKVLDKNSYIAQLKNDIQDLMAEAFKSHKKESR